MLGLWISSVQATRPLVGGHGHGACQPLGVPGLLALAVIATESRGQPYAIRVNQGPGQVLLPATYAAGVQAVTATLPRTPNMDLGLMQVNYATWGAPPGPHPGPTPPSNRQPLGRVYGAPAGPGDWGCAVATARALPFPHPGPAIPLCAASDHLAARPDRIITPQNVALPCCGRWWHAVRYVVREGRCTPRHRHAAAFPRKTGVYCRYPPVSASSGRQKPRPLLFHPGCRGSWWPSACSVRQDPPSSTDRG